MLLRLQRFNLTVKYKPGSQMLLADHLSRAAQHETSRPEESFQVFSLGLESLDPMQALKVTPERLDQLQRSTSHDDTLQTLKTTSLTGWPMQKDQLPIKIREYWSYRDELSVHNGVLFKGSRVVIPQLLRPEVKSKINSSHLGVEACLRKARETVFLPIMNAEVKDKSNNVQFATNFKLRIRSFQWKAMTFLTARGIESLLTSSHFMARNISCLLTSIRISWKYKNWRKTLPVP